LSSQILKFDNVYTPAISTQGGAEEQNPYLEGTPAYMKTLPTKAEEAKQEILVRTH